MPALGSVSATASIAGSSKKPGGYDRSVASDQPISNRTFNGTFTLNEAIEHDAQYSRQRLFSILFGIFSAMALALALVGIFSVVAYSLAQRTAEFGVRLALGAPRTNVLWVATHIALVGVAAGIVIGFAFDTFLGALFAHWMQSAFTAGSLFAAGGLLALSALLACLLPARHAVSAPLPKLSAMNKAGPHLTRARVPCAGVTPGQLTHRDWLRRESMGRYRQTGIAASFYGAKSVPKTAAEKTCRYKSGQLLLNFRLADNSPGVVGGLPKGGWRELGC